MPEHGKYSTYNNHDCRCEPCRVAARDYMANYRKTDRGRENTRKANRVALRAQRIAAKHVKDNFPELWSQCQEQARQELA